MNLAGCRWILRYTSKEAVFFHFNLEIVKCKAKIQKKRVVVHIPTWMILAACRPLGDCRKHLMVLRTHCPPHIPQAVNKTPRSLNLALGQILRRCRSGEDVAAVVGSVRDDLRNLFQAGKVSLHQPVAIGQLIPPTSHWSVSLNMARNVPIVFIAKSTNGCVNGGFSSQHASHV